MKITSTSCLKCSFMRDCPNCWRAWQTVHYSCDKCSASTDELYEYDGGMYCAECIKELTSERKKIDTSVKKIYAPLL